MPVNVVWPVCGHPPPDPCRAYSDLPSGHNPTRLHRTGRANAPLQPPGRGAATEANICNKVSPRPFPVGCKRSLGFFTFQSNLFLTHKFSVTFFPHYKTLEHSFEDIHFCSNLNFSLLFQETTQAHALLAFHQKIIHIRFLK